MRHDQTELPERAITHAPKDLIWSGLLVWVLSLFLLTSVADAGQIETTFIKHDKTSTITVDHSAWDKLLETYIKADAEGLNRVDYAAFKRDGHAALKKYLLHLQAVDVTKLNQSEQFAFWANLYNAVTIDVVLAHYPVKSIKDIDISGFFKDGPWGKKLVKVNAIALSLDDIEHKILRGLFRDPRIHYAVNCASVGCPNLGKHAFQGIELSAQLDEVRAVDVTKLNQ